MLSYWSLEKVIVGQVSLSIRGTSLCRSTRRGHFILTSKQVLDTFVHLNSFRSHICNEFKIGWWGGGGGGADNMVRMCNSQIL